MTISRIHNNAEDESGQTMAEYAVVLGLIVIVTLVAFSSLGNGIESAFVGVRSVFP
jgi:Flp pilus assembly pilin Flp